MAEIQLTRGKVAIVDDADYPMLSKYKWVAERYGNGNWRASRHIGPGAKREFMHRMLLGALPCVEIDHINRNGLDNRRFNLRLATRGQNACNVKTQSSTGLRGVHKMKHYDRYDAAIQVKGRYIYLGSFRDKYEAAKAYDAAALKYHGKFATLNGVTNGQS